MAVQWQGAGSDEEAVTGRASAHRRLQGAAGGSAACAARAASQIWAAITCCCCRAATGLLWRRAAWGAGLQEGMLERQQPGGPAWEPAFRLQNAPGAHLKATARRAAAAGAVLVGVQATALIVAGPTIAMCNQMPWMEL